LARNILSTSFAKAPTGGRLCFRVSAVEAQIPEALLELIDNPKATDICLRPGLSQVDLGQGLEITNSLAFDEDQLCALAKGLIELGGRRLDLANPFADVSLPGGLRVHAVLKSACSDQTLVSIRLHSSNPIEIAQLMQNGFATPAQLELIQQIVSRGESFLIAGATGTGKTTLLRAMLHQSNERVIAIEDVTELTGPNLICLQTKPKNIEGKGQITLAALVRQALRMRPDRICIGEVRGEEIVPMLQALNTGHRGATTLHANGLEQVPARLISIANQVGMDQQVLAGLVISAFDWVIALSANQGVRRITGMGKFEIVNQQLQVVSHLRSRKLQLA
jgi:pilus assembly protein CpaF